MHQRNYRDPVHNIISLDERVPDDKLIVDLIDSSEFQRLRRVRQLGLAMFTYQGAEHSRFTHSIGVMHLMTRALNLLGSRNQISEEARVVGRAGALLHDLGHGPFSHVVEKAFGFHHEDWTRKIVSDPNTEVNQILREFDPRLPSLLADLYQRAYKPAFVSQLVSSQLDCDRMDYLLRDSLMTGAKYGIYDLEWVLHALGIDSEADRIVVDIKGLYAVEEYLQARYYMFRQVYFHRTLRSAEAVLLATLKRARAIGAAQVSGKETKNESKEVLARILGGDQISPQEYLQLDDNDLMFQLKVWSRSSDSVLSDLSQRLLNRRLFKTLDVAASGQDSESFWERARGVVARHGFDPDYYLVKDRAADIPFYGYYSPVDVAPHSLIYIEDELKKEIREISEVSELVRSMRGYQIERLCFPVEATAGMAELIQY
ncbi:MAG TPA: HD domain-containing protein [Blastocatellia bacterium]|nr:HD domain-containing protein [Blastocatellia bacterium]